MPSLVHLLHLELHVQYAITTATATAISSQVLHAPWATSPVDSCPNTCRLQLDVKSSCITILLWCNGALGCSVPACLSPPHACFDSHVSQRVSYGIGSINAASCGKGLPSFSSPLNSIASASWIDFDQTFECTLKVTLSGNEQKKWGWMVLSRSS